MKDTIRDTGITRSLDKFWRFTIPHELLTTRHLVLGDSMEIYVENERIILEKATDGAGIVRKLDMLGRITIPREVLKSHDLKVDDSVQFYVDGARIIVKKATAA